MYSELFWSTFSRIRTEYSVQMRESKDQINSECERFSHSDSFRIHNSYYSSQKSYFLPSFSFEKNIILSLMLLPLSPTIVTNLLLNLMRSKSKFYLLFLGTNFSMSLQSFHKSYVPQKLGTIYAIQDLKIFSLWYFLYKSIPGTSYKLQILTQRLTIFSNTFIHKITEVAV